MLSLKTKDYAAAEYKHIAPATIQGTNITNYIAVLHFKKNAYYQSRVNFQIKILCGILTD